MQALPVPHSDAIVVDAADAPAGGRPIEELLPRGMNLATFARRERMLLRLSPVLLITAAAVAIFAVLR